MLIAVQTTGTPDTAAFRIRRPDGEQRILQSQARLVERDGHAKLAGTVMDITETRRLQEQLTAARDLFAGVLDAATETSIVATDPDGLITVFNRGAERILGRSAEEMVGRQTPALFHDSAEVTARATELGIEPGFEVFTHRARRRLGDPRVVVYPRRRPSAGGVVDGDCGPRRHGRNKEPTDVSVGCFTGRVGVGRGRRVRASRVR